MAEKIRIPEYPCSLSQEGWLLPTDYSKAHARFVGELISLISSSVPDKAKILDFNAGEGEIGEALVAMGYQYLALEQNAILREMLVNKNLDCRDWRIPKSELPAGSLI